MGCLKITYQPKLDLVKNTFTKELTSAKTKNKVYSGYLYGLNGMEKDDEVKGSGNSYTTEFRQYDPRLGRWLTIDPMSFDFPFESPYVAFGNNPIYFGDPYGLSPDPPVEGDVSQHLLKNYAGLSYMSSQYNKKFWRASAEDKSIMLLKKGVKPSTAINDVYNNTSLYTMDCAQVIQLTKLYVLMKTMGDKEFDKYVEGVVPEGEEFTLKQHYSTGLKYFEIYNKSGLNASGFNKMDGSGQVDKNEDGSFKNYDLSSDFVNDLPVGSQLIFKNIYGEEPFIYENVLKIGDDQYTALGFGNEVVFTYNQIVLELAKITFPKDTKGFTSLQDYANVSVYLKQIITYESNETETETDE